MYYRVIFKDVLIRGERLTWTADFKEFDAARVQRHLRDKGLSLNCSDAVRNPDAIIAEDWDDSGSEDSSLNGRILRGSSQLIGTFRVTSHEGDMPDVELGELNPGTNSRVAPNPRARSAASPSQPTSFQSKTLPSSRPSSKSRSSHPRVVTGAGYPSEVPADLSDEIPY